MLCPCTCPHAHQHTENNQDVIKFLFLLLVKYSESTKQLEPQTTTKKQKNILQEVVSNGDALHYSFY